MFRFDLQLFGGSNNAASQNQQAQQQILQNTKQAMQQIQQWMAQNPSPLTGVSAPQAPSQATGNFGGQQYGGASGGQMQGAQKPNYQPQAQTINPNVLSGVQPRPNVNAPTGNPSVGGGQSAGAQSTNQILQLLQLIGKAGAGATNAAQQSVITPGNKTPQ